MLGGQLQDPGCRAVQLLGQLTERLLPIADDGRDLRAGPEGLGELDDAGALGFAGLAGTVGMATPRIPAHSVPSEAFVAGAVADLHREPAQGVPGQQLEQQGARGDLLLGQRRRWILRVVGKFRAVIGAVPVDLSPRFPAVDRAHLHDGTVLSDAEVRGTRLVPVGRVERVDGSGIVAHLRVQYEAEYPARDDHLLGVAIHARELFVPGDSGAVDPAFAVHAQFHGDRHRIAHFW